MGKSDHITKVLIVSANAEHAEFLVKILKKMNFNQHQIMSNGLEALDKIAEETYTLLVCDQNVRFISGWLLIKEIKTSDKIPNIPLVLFGKEKAPDRPDILGRYGIIKYLQMPLRQAEFEFTIQSTLTLFASSGTVENKYTKAKESLLNNRAEEAIERYSELQNITENSLRSSIGLAQALIQDNQIAEADRVISEIAHSDEESPAKTLLEARLLMQSQTFTEANKLINKLLSAMPSALYHSKAVKMLMEFNRLDLAAPISNRAIDLNLHRPEFYLCLAKHHYSEDDLASAIETIKLHENLYGMTGELFNLRGVCLKKKGDFDRAVIAYEAALRLSPTDARVYFNLAMCSIQMKRLNDASRYLQLCLKYNPSFPKAKEKLDELSRRVGVA